MFFQPLMNLTLFHIHRVHMIIQDILKATYLGHAFSYHDFQMGLIKVPIPCTHHCKVLVHVCTIIWISEAMHRLSKLCFITSSALPILLPWYNAAKYEFDLILASLITLRSFICPGGRSLYISEKHSQYCLVWRSSVSHLYSFSSWPLPQFQNALMTVNFLQIFEELSPLWQKIKVIRRSLSLSSLCSPGHSAHLYINVHSLPLNSELVDKHHNHRVVCTFVYRGKGQPLLSFLRPNPQCFWDRVSYWHRTCQIG